MTIDANRVIRLIVDMAEGERKSLPLAALRDTLLPKLISGKLRVKDAARISAHVSG